MWMLSDLLSNMPKNWQLYQNIMLADATTFPQYSLNMRSLVIDKAGPAEMIIFNRCADDVDRMELHRLVREASRRAEISYEAPDGTVDYDEPVSYTHLTLPTKLILCRSRWSPYH